MQYMKLSGVFKMKVESKDINEKLVQSVSVLYGWAWQSTQFWRPIADKGC